MSTHRKTGGQKERENSTANSDTLPAAKLAMAAPVNPLETLTIGDLVVDLEKNKAVFTSQIQTSLSQFQTTLGVVRLKVEDSGPHMTEIENALSDHSDRLTSLEAQVKQLQSKNSPLKSKTEDLENCSHHNNLRVVGLPED